MKDIFHAWDELDLEKGTVMVVTLTVFWTGLVSIVPPKWHTAGIVISTALQGAIMYATKARKVGLQTRKEDTLPTEEKSP